MSEKFFVSFNSPQCGWMSIGLTGGGAEFHTTTAHAPHEQALPQLLKILTALLDDSAADKKFVLQWNRNPEEFDFEFKQHDDTVLLEIWQYPTQYRSAAEREKVFEFEGNVLEVCQAFHQTFTHLREDIETDEFEQNWRQPFPHEPFERFDKELKRYRSNGKDIR